MNDKTQRASVIVLLTCSIVFLTCGMVVFVSQALFQNHTGHEARTYCETQCSEMGLTLAEIHTQPNNSRPMCVCVMGDPE